MPLFGFTPRRPFLATLSGLAPAAASFLGVRVGRPLILRLSSLLALRTLLSAVRLPLDAGVVSYVWTFLFASVQASVAVAAAASYLDFGGILGAIVRRFFATPADTPFVKLYGACVIVVGPLLALLEAAVITFEIMRISRAATDRMFVAEAKGEGTVIRKIVFAVVTLCALMSSAIVYIASTLYSHSVPLIMGTILLAMYVVCLVTENGHILETAVLALVAQLTLAIGLVEELDAPTKFLDALLTGKDGNAPREMIYVFGETVSLRSPEMRAIVLMYTTTMLLVTMSRAPRFIRLLQIGADRLASEEKDVDTARGRSALQGQDTAAEIVRPASEIHGFLKGFYNALVLMAVTFRLLVWTGQVHNSEYMPALCRSVQVVAMMLLHHGYLGMEKGETVSAAEPVRDIAGNIIENPVMI